MASVATPMSRLPRDGAFDSTLALLREGYAFGSKRCALHGSDVFETRLMLRRAVCVRGEAGARMFYEPGRFTRRQAMPPTALWLLQDTRSVQMLDGDAHRARKALFLTLTAREEVARLAALFAEEWRARIPYWESAPDIVLHEEAELMLCRAACRWAGIELADEAAAARTREFSAMIDGAGSVGPRNWRALRLRARSERWARGTIAAARASAPADPRTALEALAAFRGLDGAELDVATAAVELINLLRPIVAVARYVVFAALAMHEQPHWRHTPATADEREVECFVQEVRRYYPFFPMIGGRVREAFEWRGLRFEPGTWVLLDLYGTNHDPHLWVEPQAFRPERFHLREPGAFDLVPQGGGDAASGHRCPGEGATIALMKTAVRELAALRYEVPEQDLSIRLARMPAIPESRFVMRRIRRAGR